MPQSRKVGWISVIINYTVHNRPGEICYTNRKCLMIKYDKGKGQETKLCVECEHDYVKKKQRKKWKEMHQNAFIQ